VADHRSGDAPGERPPQPTWPERDRDRLAMRLTSEEIDWSCKRFKERTEEKRFEAANGFPCWQAIVTRGNLEGSSCGRRGDSSSFWDENLEGTASSSLDVK
jgi:hypothetical protein